MGVGVAQVVRAGGDKRLAAVFGQQALTSGGFNDVREFLKMVGLGLRDDRLQLMAALNEESGAGSAGGFLVPTQFITNVLDASLENRSSDLAPTSCP